MARQKKENILILVLFYDHSWCCTSTGGKPEETEGSSVVVAWQARTDRKANNQLVAISNFEQDVVHTSWA